MSTSKLDNPLAVGNTSTNFLNQTDYKKGSLHEDIYDFSVSYQPADIKNYMTFIDI